MEFDVVEKYTAELTRVEMYLLSDLVNTCFYKNTVPEKAVEDIFFSDPGIYNFIVEHKKRIVGLFQSKDLPKIESVYFFSAAVFPEYRERGIFSNVVDKKLDYYGSKGRKYMGGRSMNPVLVESVVKKGFFLPETENPELLTKAKEILTEVEGSDLGIRTDFVIPHKNVSKYPNALDITECKDQKIADFIKAHMNIENGDRLFLIRKI